MAITISNVVATPGTGPQQTRFCTITWTTDVPSGGYVQYGLDASYGRLEGAQGRVVSHLVTLNGLVAGTTYHYRIVATIDAGNGGLGVTGDLTFGTAALEVTP